MKIPRYLLLAVLLCAMLASCSKQYGIGYMRALNRSENTSDDYAQITGTGKFRHEADGS